MHKPSIRNGLAPRDGMPRFPSLWRGCISALAPGLGPTGVLLRDWSSSRLHGTLTNMSLTTSWLMNGGYYGLDFDGSNDFCSVPLRIGGLFKCSVSMWFYWYTYANNDRMLAEYTANTNTAGNSGFWLLPNESALAKFSVRQSSGTGATNGGNFDRPSGSQWLHLGVNFDRSRGTSLACDVFLNGKQVSMTQTDSGNLSAAAFSDSTLYIGSRGGASLFGRTMVDDFRAYNRLLTANEFSLLARRRCIAYELDDQAFGYYSAPASGAARLRRILAGLP